METKNIRILLLEGIHPVAKEILESAGFSVTLESKSYSSQELMTELPKYNALGIRSKTKVTEEVIKENRRLQAIGAFCIGTDQIDLKAAAFSGVTVFNAPHSNTRSVAELVLAEIILLARRIFHKNQMLHSGAWEKSASNSFEVRGKTLGIIGYGNIGSQLSVMAEAIGLKVQFFDIQKKLPLGNTKSSQNLKELLETSDFVSLHVPDTQLTKSMISQKELLSMKKGSYLINASRGEVVDLKALRSAILSEHLAGAAIDVFPSEPASNSDGFISELQNLPNVILTPHIGGSTEEAQEAIGREVARSFIDFFAVRGLKKIDREDL